MDYRRIRSRNNSQPTYTFWDMNGTEGTQQTNWDGKLAENIDDIAHPRFHTRVKLGELFNDPMTLSKSYRFHQDGNFSFTQADNTYRWQGDMYNSFSAMSATGGYPDVDPASMANMCRNDARVKLFSKLNESTISGGENMAELGQAISMLRRPFASAGNLLKEINRLKARKLLAANRKRMALSTADALSSSWLEYSYGWKPILNDLQKLVTIIDERANRVVEDITVVRAKVNRSKNRSANFSKTLADGSFFTGFEISGNRSTDLTVVVGVGVAVRPNRIFGDSYWSRSLGLRAVDLPKLLWDLTPYSFVSDWFVNVGGWISAMTPNHGVDEVYSWETIMYNWLQRGNCSLSVRKNPYSDREAPQTYTGSGGGEELKSFSYTRLPSIAEMLLYPPLKLDVSSVAHAVSGVALISQQILSELSDHRH